MLLSNFFGNFMSVSYKVIPFQSKFNELFKNINGHFHVSLHSTPALCTLKMIINNLVQNKRKTEIQSDTLKNFGISNKLIDK